MDLFSAVFSFGSHIIATTLAWWCDPLMWVNLVWSLICYYFVPEFGFGIDETKLDGSTLADLWSAIDWRYYPLLLFTTGVFSTFGWLSHW